MYMFRDEITDELRLICVMSNNCMLALYSIRNDLLIARSYLNHQGSGNLNDCAFDYSTKQVFTLSQNGEVKRCYVGGTHESSNA
jgi:hypothetical protein